MKTPTYSVFRNRAERKRVHIIRHGESVYNAIDRYVGVLLADFSLAFLSHFFLPND